MQHFKFDLRAWTQLASLLAAASLFSTDAMAAKMAGDPAATCSGLAGAADNAVRIESAAIVAPTPLAVSERGPTPAARVTPANPEFCKVLGQIAPTDSNAPPIKFQVNLPLEWNGRSLQYGGGGFNGVLITGLALPPAYPFGAPSPLARGFVFRPRDQAGRAAAGVCAQ
jgi:feruloyl esterase